jgi:radical SAM superfamily enzyme YgiQ (UPF0313 family)
LEAWLEKSIFAACFINYKFINKDMKIDIIVVYEQRYRFGHEKNFVPPITGIHLAAITPSKYQVRVVHQQVEQVDYETEAEVVALSFFSGFAIEAYRIADRFREKGKTVIGGGPHVSFSEEESLQHFDAIVTGEAESIWETVLDDIERGQLKAVYKGVSVALDSNPTPRYDLLPDSFFVKRVVQATRGCPYCCSFCTVPLINPGFRTRPVENVLKDIEYNRFRWWWQRKIVWFWDDNLTINKPFIRELLTRMIPLKKWWLTQASIDIVKDDELLDLMRRSGCIGVFLGLESFGKGSILDANKRHNRVEEYKSAVDKLHRHGITVMAGLVSGFEHDTFESIVGMADDVLRIGVDVPYISILTPFKGTKIYEQFADDGRILKDRNYRFYNGYNVAFLPKTMTPEALLQAHRKLWRRAFSARHSLFRIARSVRYLRLGAFLMCLFMNAFYGLKCARGNLPLDKTACTQ